MRRRADLAVQSDLSASFRDRSGLVPRRGVRLAARGAAPEGSRYVETAWLVVWARKRADRIVRGIDGLVAIPLAHHARGSKEQGHVQADPAERDQRSLAAGAR